MRKMIELNKIDELLEDFNRMKNKGETFSEFIEVSGCVDEDGNKEFDWDFVDSCGIVTKGDFECYFDKKFIEENFEDLSERWFKGLNAQIDFGVVLECVKEEIEE